MEAQRRMFAGNATPHYTRVARWLHWGIAAALLAQLVFGFLLDDIAPRGTPARAAVINLHKSLGLVLAALIVLRLVWRWRHAPPAWPLAMPVWQQRAAGLGHAALYVCMAVMPLSGYVASNFSRHGVKFFGLPLAPWGPDRPEVYAALKLLHEATAVVFVLLVLGHVAVALKHAWVDRDGVFERMRGGT